MKKRVKSTVHQNRNTLYALNAYITHLYVCCYFVTAAAAAFLNVYLHYLSQIRTRKN